MAISVAELEAILSVNADKFNSGIAGVKSKLGEIESSMKNLNTGGIAFGTMLGNLGAKVIGSAFRGIKNIGKDALEYSAYNERVRVSLEALNKEEIIQANTKTWMERVGSRTISVQQQIASATALSTKEQKQQNKIFSEADKASDKLRTTLADITRINERLTEVRKKPLTPGQKQQLEASLTNKQEAVIDLNGKLQAATDLVGQKEALTQKIIAGGAKVIPIYEKRTQVMITEAEAQKKAAEMAKKTITQLEYMAIQSPFNKQNLVDSFKMLRTVGGMNNETALQYAQGIADVGTVGGVKGDRLKDLAGALGQMKQYGQLYKSHAKQIASVIPGFFDSLRNSLGVNEQELGKMFRKGLITPDKVEPIIKDFFNKYRGQAREASETLPGLLESLSDIKTLTAANFFGPIFEGFKPVLSSFVQLFTEKGLGLKISEAGTRLGQRVQASMEKIVKVVNPIVDRIMAGGLNLGTIISGISDALQQKTIPESWGAPIVFVLTFIRDHGPAISSVLTVVGTALAGLMIASQVSSVMGTLSTVFGALASPIGLIGAALGLLYVGFQTNFLGIRDIIMGVWTDIQPYWDNFVGMINLIRNGGLDWKGLFNVDPTGMAKPIVDFIAGLPKTLGDAVANLKEGDIKGVFDALWQGFGLRGLDIVNAVSAFVKNATTAIKNNAPAIAGSFFGWAAAAVGWLNLSITDIFTKITQPNGLIENIGAALGNAVGFLEKVIQPWLKTFAGKTLTPEEADMKKNTEAFLMGVANLISTSVNGIAEVGKAFVRGFWQAAGQNISEGINLFWEGIKKNLSTENILKNFSGAEGIDLEHIIFGKNGLKGFKNSPWGSVIAENLNLWPEGTTLQSFLEHAATPFDQRPENLRIPVNATLTIRNMEAQGRPAAEIQAWMNANGIYQGANGWQYDKDGNGNVVSQGTALYVPVKPVVTAAPATMGLTGGASGPVAPLTTTTIIQQAMSGMQLQADGANGLKINPVDLTVPLNVKTDIKTTSPTVNGNPNYLANINQIIYDEAFGKNKVTVTPGTDQAKVAPVTVAVPITAKVDVSTTNPTNQTTVSVTDTVAQNAGLVKDANGNYTIPNASSVTVNVPVSVALSQSTLTQGQGTSKDALDSTISSYLISAGISKDANGAYAYTGGAIAISVPVNLSITSANAQGGQSGGEQNTQSPLITSLINSINTESNTASLSAAISGLYNKGLTQFVLNNKLGSTNGKTAKDNLAFSVGNTIGTAISDGLESPIKKVTEALNAITTKMNSMKDTDVPNLKTAMGGLSTYLLTVAKPELDTFRTGPLLELNNEFQRQLTIIGQIITALGNYKTTLQNFGTPGLPSGPPSGTTGNSDREGNVNRTSSFSNPGFTNGTEGRTTNITLISTVDSDQLSKKTYKLINNQFLQEVGDY